MRSLVIIGMLIALRFTWILDMFQVFHYPL